MAHTPRRADGHRWRVLKARIITRDRGICHLCGRPGAYTADHLTPMSSRRTQPLPRDWKRIRQRILNRDGQRCQHCGAPASHVDHIIGAHAGGTDADANLQALCARCHASKTGREARAVTVARQVGARRPAEPHPGLRRS